LPAASLSAIFLIRFLSNKDGSQHWVFCQCFCGEHNLGVCLLETGTNELDSSQWGLQGVSQPVRALYDGWSSFFVDQDTAAQDHHRFGETPTEGAEAFLAFAIPPCRNGAPSSGANRLVSSHSSLFTVQQREFAGTVGAGLRLLSRPKKVRVT